ncbi:MAG: hypothetical protein ACOX7K_01995 [Oscillospiraceae bacterium]|jgi:hypothetical protein
MVLYDTAELLKECSSGIQMGVASIDGVLSAVKDANLSQRLTASKKEHEALGQETHTLLLHCGEHCASPNPVALGMSWIKTNVKLAMNETDSTVAGLITDGCNMGVKSLTGYLNRYASADEQAKDIAKRLIAEEETLAIDLRGYLQ